MIDVITNFNDTRKGFVNNVLYIVIEELCYMLWSSHTKRTRKRHGFIGFLIFPVYLPDQTKAKATSLFNWVLDPFEQKATKMSLSRLFGVA